MRAGCGLEHPRNPCPRCTCERPADQHRRQEQERGPRAQLHTDRRTRERARYELALGADVEEAGPEGQCHCNPGHDQGDRVDDRVRDLQRGVLILGTGESKATAEQTLVSIEWVRPGDCHEQATHDEGEEHRTDRNGHTLRDPPNAGRHPRRRARPGGRGATGACQCLPYVVARMVDGGRGSARPRFLSTAGWGWGCPRAEPALRT